MVIVYDMTGKKYVMHEIDAQEALKTGGYVYELPKQTLSACDTVQEKWIEKPASKTDKRKRRSRS
jgi:hypothetical protein